MDKTGKPPDRLGQGKNELLNRDRSHPKIGGCPLGIRGNQNPLTVLEETYSPEP